MRKMEGKGFLRILNSSFLNGLATEISVVELSLGKKVGEYKGHKASAKEWRCVVSGKIFMFISGDGNLRGSRSVSLFLFAFPVSYVLSLSVHFLSFFQVGNCNPSPFLSSFPRNRMRRRHEPFFFLAFKPFFFKKIEKENSLLTS